VLPQQLPVTTLQIIELQAAGIPMQLLPLAMPVHMAVVQVPEQHSEPAPQAAVGPPQQLPVLALQMVEAHSAALPSQLAPLGMPAQTLAVQVPEQHCEPAVQPALRPLQQLCAVTLQAVRAPHERAPQPPASEQPQR
jgi:hypothetical protein